MQSSQTGGAKPKVFISYSWSSPGHQARVREWATRLANDGVEIILDQFDLKEGQDKFAYMEKMVTDASVTHVLLFVDKRYAEKADGRKAGVGTESQIISKEIYEKIEQSKFVPIVCEIDENGEPYLPVFLRSRIWLDFSSDETTNINWERLIRLLYGKPLYEKPQAGKPPAYILEQVNVPSSPAMGKFSVFKNAFFGGQKGINIYRSDFLDSCVAFVDELRPRVAPSTAADIPQSIVEGYRRLIPARNLITDWVLLEAGAGHTEAFEAALIEFLERLMELRGRPQEATSYNDLWYEAHKLFVFETFLYVVAALLKVGDYAGLHAILMGSYLKPHNVSNAEGEFVSFAGFYGFIKSINAALTVEKITYHSQAAELLKRNADRKDIPLAALKEADALVYLAAVVKGVFWYPQFNHYWSYGEKAGLFLRATQHKHFTKVSTILGINSADEIREKFAALKKDNGWGQRDTFENLVNLDKLDTIA